MGIPVVNTSINSFFPESIFCKIKTHSESAYPFESCGFILLDTSHQTWDMIPCKNIQDLVHAEDPQQYPRTAKNGFWVDPKDLLKIHHLTKDGQKKKIAFYHSHIDSPAILSALDLQNLLEEEIPWDPNLTQVVASVQQGKCVVIEAYQWDFASKRYKNVLSGPQKL